MKLLLTSGGLMNQSIIDALRELTERPFAELNLAFIPTAANLEEGDKWWLIEDLATCKKLGFKEVDIVDISALPKTVWKKRLENADVLLFEGGNTYHLRYWVRKSGLEELLPKFLETKVYIGISAGSIIATPSLILSTAEKKSVEEIDENIVEQGLRLVNFLIEPHLNSKYFPEVTLENITNIAKQIKETIYAIDDDTAIKVVDGKIDIISEGIWKKFK